MKTIKNAFLLILALGTTMLVRADALDSMFSAEVPTNLQNFIPVVQESSRLNILDELQVTFKKAWDPIKNHIIGTLNAAPQTSQREVFFGLLSFVMKNDTLFTKWPAVCKTFSQELKKNMPVDEIMAFLGASKETITLATHSEGPTTAAAREAESTQKDTYISRIIERTHSLCKNQEKLQALTGFIAMGFGWMAKKFGIKSIKEATPEKHKNPEAIIVDAFKIALKTHLSVAELASLVAFSETKTFQVLTEQVWPCIEIALAQDQSIINKLQSYFLSAI